MRLDFIIIAAQKSGTTFIHECLKENPEIYMPDSETPIFSDPLFKDKAYFNNVVSDLEMHKSKITGIKRPSFMFRPHVAQRIKRFVPNAKFIISLRNPVDRAVSGYFHNMRMKLGPFMNPDNGISHLIKHRSFKNYPRSKWVLEYGLYAKHLEKFFKYFPKRNFLIIFHEDLKKIL